LQFYKAGSIKYYKFASFENQGLYHAVFTRHGGISPTPWKSLNFGASVGDDINRVRQNREKALEILNAKPDSVFDVYQVHSSEVILTDRALRQDEPHIKADAIITNSPNVTLLMRFADCVPILLFDPINRAIGLSHAGWIGTVNKIAEKTVHKMKNEFGTNPDAIIAGIGPSIGPDHYVVGKEVEEKVISSFGNLAEQLILQENGKMFFNLWHANQVVLNQAGVNKIEVAEMCTNCNLDDWYSHRGELGKTGRFGVILGLN
jgi:purine-nucleoside/S-methyl-5'-thioadenosine phosphorylase / adenosine deaminase